VLTDCKEGSDRGTIVHAAELQVFGADATLPDQPDPSGAGGSTGGTGTGTGTGTTPPAQTTPPTARVRPTVSLTVRRRIQTTRNRAPKLLVEVSSPSALPAAGRLVVVIDGKRWKSFTTRTGERTVLVTKRLLRGRHTVRVRFRPADRSALAPARSRLQRIVVTRR
jgi:extracellular elastinolytic metalloproteinase